MYMSSIWMCSMNIIIFLIPLYMCHGPLQLPSIAS